MGSTMAAVFVPAGCLCQKIFFCVSAGSALCPLSKSGAGVSVRFPIQAALPALFGRVSFFRPLPCGKVTVILLHNRLRFAVGWQAVVSASEGPDPANAVYCTKRAAIRFPIKLDCSVKSIAPINALFFPFNLSNNPILNILK